MSIARLLALFGMLLCLLAPAYGEAPDLDKVRDLTLKRELKALDEAATVLEGVNDEASAKKAIIKLNNTFRQIPPTVHFANQQVLEIWAKAQNRVSFQMWRLKDEPYFEKLKFQELWTLISDPFSRPTR